MSTPTTPTISWPRRSGKTSTAIMYLLMSAQLTSKRQEIVYFTPNESGFENTLYYIKSLCKQFWIKYRLSKHWYNTLKINNSIIEIVCINRRRTKDVDIIISDWPDEITITTF